MAKNLFDGLSPQAAFASKLLAAAGLDLAALTTAGDVNALKVALENAKSNPDLAAAITEATSKLTADLSAAGVELEKAKTAFAALEKNNSALSAAVSATGIDLKKCATEKDGFSAEAFAASHKLLVATAARTELARHGIANPLPEVITTDAAKKPEKKPGEGLTGSAKVAAIFASSKLLSERAQSRA